MANENISELVWLYIKRRPFMREILRQRVVNYSALARKIGAEAFGSRKHINAIKMALQRISARLQKGESDLEGKILSVLKKSSISIRTKVAVVVSATELPVKPISYAKSADSVTYIIPESELKTARCGSVKGTRYAKAIRRIEENANLITISSGEEIEDTPGVIAMILDSLSSEGINVLEFISCYTDTLLVLKQADTTRAYEILSALME